MNSKSSCYSLPTQYVLFRSQPNHGGFNPQQKQKFENVARRKKRKCNPRAISGRSWPTAPSLIGSGDKNELLANVNESVSGGGRECTHSQHTTKVVLEPVSFRAFLVDTAKAGGCIAMQAVVLSLSLPELAINVCKKSLSVWFRCI